MRVLMVDDHMMVLQGLRSLLEVLMSDLDIDMANALGTALTLAAGTRYDLVLLDWNLEDLHGDEAIRRLRDVGCTARIVILSGESKSSLIQQALECGAAGFIPKRYSSEAMVGALELVLDGGIFLPPEVPGDGQGRGHSHAHPLIDAEQRIGELTPRQIDVYRAAARGLPNKLIGRELGIAESTVKTHLQAVYAVLGVRNRTEAAWQASREGIRIG
ncbi:MAG: response regulator transcription factor [Variovorax sp.]|jgi:DNA-binding NarL/FixJ family response regulator|nr:MAG: response regulator transcription factor [Variovorax sp.]